MSSRLHQPRIDTELFNEVLTGSISSRFHYFRAYPCPCRSAAGNSPSQRCPVCKGRGTYFDDPPEVAAEETFIYGSTSEPEVLRGVPLELLSVTVEGVPANTSDLTHEDGVLRWLEPPDLYSEYTVRYRAKETLRAGITQVLTKKQLAERGMMDSSSIHVSIDRLQEDKATPNPAWDAGVGDRFRLVDTRRREDQHVKRTGGYDLLKYMNAYEVTLTSVLNGAIYIWRPGEDYTVENGVITWIGERPGEGDFYAATFQANPEYAVFGELPQTRHIDGQPLPRRFLMQLAEYSQTRRPE